MCVRGEGDSVVWGCEGGGDGVMCDDDTNCCSCLWSSAWWDSSRRSRACSNSA